MTFKKHLKLNKFMKREGEAESALSLHTLISLITLRLTAYTTIC